MRLSRDDILKAEDSAPVEVHVPEWGGSVLVRGMTGKERDAFEASMSLQPDRRGQVRPADPLARLVNIRAKIVVRCVVDDDGKRLFTEADVAVLGDKSAAALERVFEVASRLSGMGDKDMEEYAANFGRAGGDDSSSPSPRASARPSKGS